MVTNESKKQMQKGKQQSSPNLSKQRILLLAVHSTPACQRAIMMLMSVTAPHRGSRVVLLILCCFWGPKDFREQWKLCPSPILPHHYYVRCVVRWTESLKEDVPQSTFFRREIQTPVWRRRMEKMGWVKWAAHFPPFEHIKFGTWHAHYRQNWPEWGATWTAAGALRNSCRDHFSDFVRSNNAKKKTIETTDEEKNPGR